MSHIYTWPQTWENVTNDENIVAIHLEYSNWYSFIFIHTHKRMFLSTEYVYYNLICLHMKVQWVYLSQPIPNLRGNHPTACLSKSEPLTCITALALRTRGGSWPMIWPARFMAKPHTLSLFFCIVTNKWIATLGYLVWGNCVNYHWLLLVMCVLGTHQHSIHTY